MLSFIHLTFLLALFSSVFSTPVDPLSDAVSDPLSLLKRQAPGSPAYKCHENCGNAILMVRKGPVCHKKRFHKLYHKCLKCAGPKKQNIWKWYGPELKPAAKKCGLPTKPFSAGEVSTTTSSVETTSSASVYTSMPSTSSVVSLTSSEVTTTTSNAGTGFPTMTPPSNTTWHTTSPPEFTNAADSSSHQGALWNGIGFLGALAMAGGML